MLEVGFIGASKAGTVLARYFKSKGIRVGGFFSCNSDALDETLKIVKCNYFSNITDLVKSSSIIFITTKDDDIKKIWEQIDHKLLVNKFIFHCSGAISSDIFVSEVKGVIKGSIHPIISISNKTMNLDLFKDVVFAIEGDDLALKEIHKLLNITQNKFITLKSTNKMNYHIACVAMTSLYISLYAFANKLFSSSLKDKEVNTSSILLNLSKVVMNNIKNNSNLKDIITGPLIRQDYAILNQHIQELDGVDRDIYQSLSKNLGELFLAPDLHKVLLNTLQLGE